ncbi:hypothetical protein H257_13496 [Aphanomyces astaci]|uniref:Uncharacterized protein n=1 Tax=Aphanomyces astaci TaxID=112090 RepID=W4FW00_APHAT|nr:hypothetical protein H257_13496 [Aphanomyces astaci]ETV71091.1 hypothetical protein H257_13496 [Aphanomyces astaci]|eukprot:XP_009839337.1 hypothetical protein H257_13496 [Aphanomyces astaci]
MDLERLHRVGQKRRNALEKVCGFIHLQRKAKANHLPVVEEADSGARDLRAAGRRDHLERLHEVHVKRPRFPHTQRLPLVRDGLGVCEGVHFTPKQVPRGRREHERCDEPAKHDRDHEGGAAV